MLLYILTYLNEQNAELEKRLQNLKKQDSARTYGAMTASVKRKADVTDDIKTDGMSECTLPNKAA